MKKYRRAGERGAGTLVRIFNKVYSVHYVHLKQAKEKLETELLFSQRYQNIRD